MSDEADDRATVAAWGTFRDVDETAVALRATGLLTIACLGLVTAAALPGTIGIAQAARCSVSAFRTGLDYPHSQASMVVSKDGACAVQVHSRFQPGVVKTFHSISVLTRARHGISGRSSAFLVGYKPNAGYAGADHFTVAIAFDENGVNGETILDVEVDVADR